MINLDKSENWSNWEDWLETKRAYYSSKTGLQVYGGIIDFDPDKQKNLVGGEKITYDEYLDLQMEACENKGKVRWYLAMCYYYIPLEFRGQIERITGRAVCFKQIYVSGMYPDGTCFDGKEEHVWIDKHGLEQYAVGDCLSFFAEPYRYIKTGSGSKSTIDEFCQLDVKAKQEVIEFIKDFVVYEEVSVNDKDYLFVHAGLGNYSPEKEIEDYSLHELLWMRADYDVQYFEHTYVVTGHTPTQTIEGNPHPGYIYQKNHHIAIDCGAHYPGGRLAALCLDTGEAYYSTR